MRVSALRISALVCAVALVLGLLSQAVLAASVDNGGFEDGDFDGWTVRNRPGVDNNGSWFVYSGSQSPLSALDIASPPQGRFAAVTDQDQPSSQILYQDLELEAGAQHTLSFILYYQNRADEFFTPNTLNFNVEPNQQYRVDLLDPDAPVDSVDEDDILLELFRTEEGDPNTLAPTKLTFDLTPFAGRTVRLRFAVTVTEQVLNASVDDVKLETSSLATATPTITPMGQPTATPTATPDFFTPPDDDKDKPRKLTEEQKQQRQRTNRGGLDDTRTEGNVLGVRCEAGTPVPSTKSGFVAVPDDVPYALIATGDGIQQVRLLDDARTVCRSIRVGDYLTAEGEKVHEQLFDAYDADVERR